MVYNVNRKKGAKFEQPSTFMMRKKAKEGTSHKHRVSSTTPQAGARYALPGERFPSRRAPGQKDQVIQRFDSYMKAIQGTEVPPHGR